MVSGYSASGVRFHLNWPGVNGCADKAELISFTQEVDLYTHEGKTARAAELAEDAAISDSSSLCTFNFVPVAIVPGLINAAAGTNYTLEDLRVIMRRIITLERKFNIREGFTRKDDTLPTRLLNERLLEGMAEGEGLDLMLDDYYQIRGWIKEGIPPA